MTELPIMVVGTGSAGRRAAAALHFSSSYELVYVSPDIDEKQIRHVDPFILTSAIAHAKMAELRAKVAQDTELQDRIARRQGSVAVTFDQVVYFHGEIREKPESVEEATAFIRSYSNNELDTVMTTVLHDFDTHVEASMPNTTRTFYREIPEEAIARVVQRASCLHNAGGFSVSDVDMKSSEIKIEPGTEEDVRGFCAASVRLLMAKVRGPQSDDSRLAS
ncbi:Maf-like protein [Novymonas esmeraldas]|uniref:Maf-like protein n=1 Tax=Novymonas esmeraldas TaxID=1808958 RepID=A0AAW0F0H9_9TRYP